MQAQLFLNNPTNLLPFLSTRNKRPSYKPHSKFCEDEDKRLRELVAQYGDNSWIQIASQMPGRNSRQCRERWMNYLSPHLNVNDWTPEEDDMLLEKHKEYGTSWVRICKFFEGRTDQMCKNRFFLLKRKIDKKANKKKACKQQLVIQVPNNLNQSCDSSPLQFEHADSNEMKNEIELKEPLVKDTSDLAFLDYCHCQDYFDSFVNFSDETFNNIECDDYFL